MDTLLLTEKHPMKWFINFAHLDMILLTMTCNDGILSIW